MNVIPPSKVSPDELTVGFEELGLGEGDAVMLHASLESMGTVEGGAAMVLHRLLKILGKSGTLLMPTFTSITRHGISHDDYAKPGCWCEGKETLHVPFIPELQPDKPLGSIAHRLCSWPASRRSKHPAYSYVAVGKHTDELVSRLNLSDPLAPVKKLLQYDSKVVTIGQGFEMVTGVHVAEQERVPAKFAKERALAMSSKGQVWVDIVSLGCSRGYIKLKPHISVEAARETKIGLADANAYRMKTLVDAARGILLQNRAALQCGNDQCLSCQMLDT